jgi:predicted flap endonuclease-1-like 5' DNA nuclease
MQMDLNEHDDAIRARAYAIWEQEGRPDGRDLIHWQRAMIEIAAEKAEGDIALGADGAELGAMAEQPVSEAAHMVAMLSQESDDAEGDEEEEDAEDADEDSDEEDDAEEDTDEDEDGDDNDDEDDESEGEPAKAALAGLSIAGISTDVSLIDGIGPKIAAQLDDIGITSLYQVSALSNDEMAEIDTNLGLRGRSAREEWVSQAKELISVQTPRAKIDQGRMANA